MNHLLHCLGHISGARRGDSGATFSDVLRNVRKSFRNSQPKTEKLKNPVGLTLSEMRGIVPKSGRAHCAALTSEQRSAAERRIGGSRQAWTRQDMPGQVWACYEICIRCLHKVLTQGIWQVGKPPFEFMSRQWWVCADSYYRKALESKNKYLV